MWVITYQEANQARRIYAFLTNGSHLHVNYWGGQQWQWADQRWPDNSDAVITPGVIAYKESNQAQRIYAFTIGRDLGGDNRLHVNYWDGVQWHWADQGLPPGHPAAVAMQFETPGVITYKEGNQPQRIYVFVLTRNYHIYSNYWDGSNWQWLDLGTPARGVRASSPSAITYKDTLQPQRITTFCVGDNGRLYENNYSGALWGWASRGKPTKLNQQVNLASSPGAITYKQNAQPRRTYVFVVGQDKRLYVNYRIGAQWQWADQGTPSANVDVSLSPPSVVTYSEPNQTQRIYAFVIGNDKNLYTNYWDGFQWQWSNLGTPIGFQIDFSTPIGSITYRDENGTQKIHVFVECIVGQTIFGRHLFMNYWDGLSWQWSDQGEF